MKFKKYFPILMIFIIWGIFSSPYFLRQGVPFASRYLVNFFSPWSAYSEFGSPVKNDAMPDVIGQIYPWRVFTVETWKNGFVPLWNPYSFSGTPHLANYQSAVLSPLNLGFYILPFIDWWSILILLQPLLAGVLMYAYMKSLKVNYVSALMSAVSFMFCGFIVSWMGYGTLAYAILFLPLALLSIEKYTKSLKTRYLVLLSMTLPLSFFSGHFQMSIYFLLFVLAYSIYKFVQTKNIHTICYVLFATILGLLLSATQLIPSIELYTQSFRSIIFQKTEVIPWGYLPTLLAPDFYGNPVTRNAWFGHYAEWNAYIGLIPLVFAVYALGYIKKGTVLFFSISGLISLLLAFQSPLLDLLVMLKIPVLSTSAFSRIIVLFSFSAAVLSGLGFNYFYLDIDKNNFKKIIKVIIIFAVSFALLWFIIFFKLFIPADKISIVRSNLLLPMGMFIALCVAVTGIILIKKQRIRLLILGIILLIVFMDLLRFSTKWQPFEPRNLMYPEVGITAFYKNISGHNRVVGNYGAEDSVYYKLPSLEGYDAVYIRRYGQFMASLESGKLQDSARSVVQYPKGGKYTLLAADLLGVKYIVHKISDGQNVWEFPFWKYDPKSLKLLFDDGRYQVLENTNSFERVFLVSSVIVEKDKQQILNKMFSKNTNLRKVAVVEDSKIIKPKTSGVVKILAYKPNIITIKTNSKGQSFLVLTDAYYPGWEARVDGKLTKIYRIDFAFRGIEIPKGTHKIEFIYSPKTFYYGVIAAIMGVIGILGLCILNMRFQRKKHD